MFLMAANRVQQIELTYGDAGVNIGFLISSYGSVSPTEMDAGLFGAAYEIRSIRTNSLGNLIAFELSGTSRPQSLFSEMRTSLGTYRSADATYYANHVSGGYTRWEWAEAADFPTSGSELVTFVP